MFRPFGPERHKLALYKANKISVLEDSGARNPFRQDDYPRSQLPSTVHVHCRAAHLLVSVQMNSCLPEQLSPITGTPTARYPVAFDTSL